MVCWCVSSRVTASGPLNDLKHSNLKSAEHKGPVLHGCGLMALSRITLACCKPHGDCSNNSLVDFYMHQILTCTAFHWQFGMPRFRSCACGISQCCAHIGASFKCHQQRSQKMVSHWFSMWMKSTAVRNTELTFSILPKKAELREELRWFVTAIDGHTYMAWTVDICHYVETTDHSSKGQQWKASQIEPLRILSSQQYFGKPHNLAYCRCIPTWCVVWTEVSCDVMPSFIVLRTQTFLCELRIHDRHHACK